MDLWIFFTVFKKLRLHFYISQFNTRIIIISIKLIVCHYDINLIINFNEIGITLHNKYIEQLKGYYLK